MMPMLGDAGFFNEDMERRAAELLDNVGLERWRDSMVTQLSGGQQQRVAVARSLAMDPPLLLADEPTGNLDTKAADAVFELLQKANRERGMAILFVTTTRNSPGVATASSRSWTVRSRPEPGRPGPHRRKGWIDFVLLAPDVHAAPRPLMHVKPSPRAMYRMRRHSMQPGKKMTS